jgi:hypothetical protein
MFHENFGIHQRIFADKIRFSLRSHLPRGWNDGTTTRENREQASWSQELLRLPGKGRSGKGPSGTKGYGLYCVSLWAAQVRPVPDFGVA